MRPLPPALLLLSALVTSQLVGLAASDLKYPQTRKVDHVDTYHGTAFPDPYRWLEDDNSPDTEKWVGEQNKVTFGYLAQIPYRSQLKARLEQLYNYPKYSAPTRRGRVLLLLEE